MFKFFTGFLIALSFLFVAVPSGYAQETKQVTIVNPIRGRDFWDHKFDPLNTPVNQYRKINSLNLEATWLVRYDALKDEKIVEFLKSLNPKQEVGIFFEVTPSLTQDAAVNYNQSENWHYAKSILLTGYNPPDRIKLMDTAVNRYKELFGKNPKSVGAWWIDASSLAYLKDKYQIETSLDVADQFSTDGYQVWGQYWSVPFYPSKANALMPAQSANQSLDLVMIQWAHRDPFNGYGNGVFESTYSVQANDYILHDLGIGYFSKLLDIYPQITIGLENDFDYQKFGPEYERQVETVSQKASQNQLEVRTMSSFAQNYKSSYPEISPSVLINAADPLGTEGRVVWYQTPKYRVGWFYGPYGSVIRDLREFNDSNEEECLKKSCDSLKLAFSSVSSIDEVNFGSRWVIDEGKISDVQVKKEGGDVIITYTNQAGLKRTINFLPSDIKIDDDIKPISTFILRAVEQSQNASVIKNQDESEFISQIQWDKFVPDFVLDVFKFLVFSILFFFLPGWVLTRKVLFALPVGWVIFTLSVFVLGYINMDIMIWFLPLLAAGILFKTGIPKINFKLRFTGQHLVLAGIIISGSITWLITQVKNGLPMNYGFGYWGPNGHDAIWHLSLISELSRNIPPQNPVFAGQMLTNYHYFFDLLLARTSVLFAIDPQNLLFRLFPVCLAFLTGAILFAVVKSIMLSRNASESTSGRIALLSTFFLYFGGSFGWVISYFRNGGLGGETTFWAQQSVSSLLNPPFAISVTLLLSGLYYYHHFRIEKKINWRYLAIIAIVWGSLIEFKAYAGVLVAISLTLITIERIFSRDIKFLYLLIITGSVALIVFLPNNLGSQTLLELNPLWLVDTMVSYEDRLFIPRLYLTMQSGVFYKVFPAFILAIAIFLIGNMGTRFISVLNPKTFIEHRFLAIFTLLGMLLPLLFIQKGNNWNIVQFMYYSLIILGFFASVSIVRLSQKAGKIGGIVFVLLVVLTTIPTTLDTMKHYLPKRPPAKLSTAEIEALNTLKSQPAGIIFVLNFNERLSKQFGAPKPLAVYTSTSYVSAFSAHPVFMEDTVNLEILGIDFKGRLNLIREFSKGTEQSKKILKDNNISYVYLLKKYNIPVDEGRMGMQKIFENDEAQIFKVN